MHYINMKLWPPYVVVECLAIRSYSESLETDLLSGAVRLLPSLHSRAQHFLVLQGMCTWYLLTLCTGTRNETKLKFKAANLRENMAYDHSGLLHRKSEDDELPVVVGWEQISLIIWVLPWCVCWHQSVPLHMNMTSCKSFWSPELQPIRLVCDVGQTGVQPSPPKPKISFLGGTPSGKKRSGLI
jgi:hypothetical protein